MIRDRVKIDANNNPVQGLNSLVAKKTLTFDGTSIGDVGTDDLFTVTGEVLVDVLAFIKTSLEGATATIEVGVADATAAIIAQETATDLDANMMWRDGSVGLAEAFTPRYVGIGGGLDIFATVGTAAITAGVIDFYCFWYPMSDDGRVVAA